MTTFPRITLLPILLSVLNVHIRLVAAEEWLDLAVLNRRASSSRNVPAEGYYVPQDGGGAMLTVVNGTFPAGLGEPLNIILSGSSDDAVLVDQMDNGGLRNYFQSIGFSAECLGQHDTSDQGADLGDGNGTLNETSTLRWNYGDPTLGTCKETIQGGNHFRYWIQNGKNGNSGAIFLAASYELPIAQDHDIITNGYNLGRDWLIGNATSNTTIPTSNLTNSSTFSGHSSASGYTYQTDVLYVSGLLSNTSDGINHFQSVANDDNNAIDGLVAVMTVKITQQPQRTASASSSLPLFLIPSGIISSFPLLFYLLFTYRP